MAAPEPGPQPPVQPRSLLDAGRWLGELAGFVVDRIESADVSGAERRVRELRERHPDWDNTRLVRFLTERKARQTALIGAATAGGALLPGLGTLVSVTVGMAADIGATAKLDAELVLEIAAVHGRRLSADERRQVVGFSMGTSLAQTQIVARSVRGATAMLVRRYGTSWLTKGVPLLGAATSASANALATNLIGRRADVYFSLPPDATDEPQERIRAITGVDTEQIGARLRGVTDRFKRGDSPP